ncbi:hypothetical protein AQUCO_07700029v1 [Aquilegia coerulea]|uniref:Large ribosomal subunit protein bL32c n=1 Tax=Aquilegia coerulea TaxID=218851 RepID=A0A2G5C845_AQUCA|nr:hypothetical protein AQUCO_07700029v1 [Aquilegia coerulea]
MLIHPMSSPAAIVSTNHAPHLRARAPCLRSHGFSGSQGSNVLDTLVMPASLSLCSKMAAASISVSCARSSRCVTKAGLSVHFSGESTRASVQAHEEEKLGHSFKDDGMEMEDIIDEGSEFYTVESSFNPCSNGFFEESEEGGELMAVPKKRTSRTKSRIRKNCWKRKANVAALKAYSLAKSLATGNSKSFFFESKTKEKE